MMIAGIQDDTLEIFKISINETNYSLINETDLDNFRNYSSMGRKQKFPKELTEGGDSYFLQILTSVSWFLAICLLATGNRQHHLTQY